VRGFFSKTAAWRPILLTLMLSPRATSRAFPPESIPQLAAAVADLPGAEWATPATCQRYLRARDGDLAKATSMLRESLQWRADFGVATLVQDHAALLRAEGATGKLRVSVSRDREGRPVLVMTPRLENSKDHLGNLRNLVYNLERACAQTEGGSDGKMIVVMDFRGYSLFTAPPMKTSKATLTILQNHYPERLCRFIVLHAPGIFSGFYKVISPFIDPVTKAKINFITGSAAAQSTALAETFDLATWEETLGGELPFTWDAEAYFAADPHMDAATKEAAVTIKP